MKRLFYIATFILAGFAAYAQQPINAGFENWDTLGIVDGQRLYVPVSWQTTNSESISMGMKQPAKYTTDAHTGKYALVLTSITDDNDAQMGVAISGSGFAGLQDAGEKFALTGKPKKFGAWVKYYPEGQDSFTVMIMFYKEGTFLGSAYIRSASTMEDYTKVEQNIEFNLGTSTPDSAKIGIMSGQDIPFSKTYLTIDDIYVEYEATTGIGEQQIEKIGVYPNPATSSVKLLVPTSAQLTQVTVVDVQGKSRVVDVDQQHQINVDTLPSGIYMIHGIDKDGKSYQAKFIKE